MPGELHCYCKKIESPKSREKKFEIEIRLEYTSTSDNLLLRNLNLSQMCIFYINYINGNIFYLGFGIFWSRNRFISQSGGGKTRQVHQFALNSGRMNYRKIPRVKIGTELKNNLIFQNLLYQKILKKRNLK